MELPDHLSIGLLGNGNSLSAIGLSAAASQRIVDNRSYLDSKLQRGGTHYGINTGFGSLCNVRVKPDELATLQENLVCSHACGMGAEVPEAIVRLMLLLKVHGLSRGYSGVRTEIVQRLVDLYNCGITPIVYELGSLGASGDLAPLAHMCLPIFGKGEVYYNGDRMPAMEALQQAGITPMNLAAKEGLALLNGTQFMSAHLSWALIQAHSLIEWADTIGALSADAFLSKDDPFTSGIHRVRPHKGQVSSAARILKLLSGSQLQAKHKEQVQDPYSFRCMPQVHGATADVIEMASAVVETEINSVTDNPIVFHDEDKIVSGGNFHGQPLALQADFLAIALAELANISERRTYLLVSGQRGLPPFLAADAGLNSGFMIAQYTAAAIVSKNKQLCTPSSVDSIVSSNGQEDHVSMGANAVTKLRTVVENVRRVLAIELLTACQALEFRRPEKTSNELERIYTALRGVAPFMEQDEVLHYRMIAAEELLKKQVSEL